MALVVLDASVVIGFRDPEDALHEASVAAVSHYRTDQFLIPVTVYAEILVGPFRAGPRAVDALDAFVQELPVQVDGITTEMARAAARLRSRTGVRLPDALVIAFTEAKRADVVLTGDARWRKLSRRVRLVT